MKSYQLSPAAIQDLEQIEARIVSERPSAVGGVLDAIESACQLVAEYPGVGRARAEIDEGVMSFSIGSYTIFYYLDETRSASPAFSMAVATSQQRSTTPRLS